MRTARCLRRSVRRARRLGLGNAADAAGQPPTPPQPIPPAPQPEPRAPSTSFAKHPPATLRTQGSSAKVVFRFRSDQTDAAFLCKVDKAAFASCGPKLVRRFAIGRHTVKVKARGVTGLVDPTPAVFSFRVVAVS